MDLRDKALLLVGFASGGAGVLSWLVCGSIRLPGRMLCPLFQVTRKANS